VLAVRSDLSPEIKGKLLQVWDEALAFYKSNPNEAKAIIAANVGSTPEELTTAFDGIQFYSVAENKDLFNGKLPQTLTNVAEVSQSIGLFESAPNLSTILDLTAYSQ
jgi:NitT/TauT family transport system substrate-binding protein